MTQQSVKYIHLRHVNYEDKQPASKGGMTIAYSVLPSGRIAYAKAKCNMNDLYCKKTGRAKAGGRLNSPSLSLHTIGAIDEKDFVTNVYDQWRDRGNIA